MKEKNQDKCCMKIIDGGKLENLVSTKVIEKLGIKCQPHPAASKVSWLQKGHHVMVTQQCLINFKIGRLHDNMLCDVFPMDSYHLLLGKPWKYR